MMSNELKPLESYPGPCGGTHTASHGSLGRGDRVQSSSVLGKGMAPLPPPPRVLLLTDEAERFLGPGHLAATRVGLRSSDQFIFY